MGNHDAIVYAEALVRRVHAPAPLLGHLPHHLLEALIASHAAYYKHLVAAHVRHRALRDLHQHGEDGLLQTEAQVLGGDPVFLTNLLAPRDFSILLPHLRGQQVGGAEDAAEAAVHAFHGVGEVEEAAAATGEQLDVVAGRGVVADVEGAREAVEAVADGDVEGLAEDPVPPLGVRDHLRVAPAHVQHDRVLRARDLAPHLDVPHAVVHPDEGETAPEEGERARGDGDGL